MHSDVFGLAGRFPSMRTLGNSQDDRIDTMFASKRVRNTYDQLFVKLYTAAGPESLEDYFQKGALLGQKAGKKVHY